MSWSWPLLGKPWYERCSDGEELMSIKAKVTQNKEARRAIKPRAGASRVARKPRGAQGVLLFRRLAKVVVLSGVFCSVAVALVWFNPQQKIEQLTHRPINAIQIEGSFRYLSKESTEEIVEQLVSGSFLDLNIAELKRELETNPWVDSVSVAREWPDKLIVRVVEQQPIARWGEKGFLNMRGDIVHIEKATKIDALPFFKGNDVYAKEIMQQYLSMGKLLSQSNLELAAVDLDQTLAWTLTLSNGITIKLGRDRLWEKLQYLVTAKEGMLGDNLNKVQGIDMRYPGGFAVAWKDSSDEHYVAGG